MFTQKISIAAAYIGRFVKSKTPSDIVPFKGKFPLVDSYQNDKYEEAIKSYDDIKDSPEWLQEIIFKGLRMYNIDNDFRQYLASNNISLEDFKKKSSSDKATELIRFFNANSLTLDSLKI